MYSEQSVVNVCINRDRHQKERHFLSSVACRTIFKKLGQITFKHDQRTVQNKNLKSITQDCTVNPRYMNI